MIEVQGLSKVYGEVRAVDAVDFVARDGKVTGFLGPNGAGKSTAMRMMSGLESPDNGSVRVDGVDPSRVHSPIHAMGLLLDGQGALPGLRARDYLLNVAAPAGIASTRVDEVLNIVGLQQASRRRVRTFSLGMKQRLGIAVAMLGDPKHLILDEPINGLDPEGVIWVRGLLRTLAGQGRSVFLSSHLMSELEQCVDDLVIIQAGRVITHGPLGDIMGAHGRAMDVSSSDDEHLASRLRSAGAGVTASSSGLGVTGLDADDIGVIARDGGIALRLLAPRHERLEDRYLSIVEEGNQN